MDALTDQMHPKAVEEETAKASFDMSNSFGTRASQLSLGGTTNAPKQQMHRPFSMYSATSASDTKFVSDREATLARSETTREGSRVMRTFGVANVRANFP